MGAITLGELALEGKTVKIYCNRCFMARPSQREPVKMTAAALGALIGFETPIDEGVRFLRCPTCGRSGKERGAVTIWPEQDPIGPMGASRPD